MIIASLLGAMTALAALGMRADAPRRPEGLRAAVPRVPSARRRAAGCRAVWWIVGSAAIAIVLSPFLAIAFIVCASAWPRVSKTLAARARQRAIDLAWPEAVEVLILVVQAGVTPHQTIEMLVELAPPPTRPGFTEVCRRTTRGEPLADALHGLVDELGVGASNVVDTLAMAERYGTPIAVALEQLAVDVRERRRRQAEAHARQLPIRMSFPLVTCTLPSFVLVAIVPAVLASLSSLTNGGI